MELEQRTQAARLPASTSVGEVSLAVRDLGRSLDFYRDIIGYTASETSDGSVHLADGTGNVNFVLHENPGAEPKPRRTSGLFHAAILLPARRDLARIVQQLVAQGWQLGGASDHGVSEALYLDDPDGNGLEIYVDRPRASWPRSGERVEMKTEPLNFESLFGELSDNEPVWSAIPAGTTIGHIHLQVGDLERSEQFYVNLLGFDVMQDTYPGALFVAAGGYHHHIGMNVWAGRGVPHQPDGSAGLTRFTVSIPDGQAWDDVTSRLIAGGTRVDSLDDASAVLSDPDGIQILLRRA